MPSWMSLSQSTAARVLESASPDGAWTPDAQPERDIGLHGAYRIIQQCLAGYQVQAFVDDRPGFTAAYADIVGLETDGKYTHGAGKGDQLEAAVGALAELTEHFFSGPDHFDPTIVELGRNADFPPLVRREPSLARLISGQPSATIACANFRPVVAPEFAPVPVPLYLWAPWYAGYDSRAMSIRASVGDTTDYRTAVTSSVNSGCAFGASIAEAVLHGMNELIERDALSLFLRRTFITPQPTGAIRLRIAGSFLEDEARRVGPDVELIEISSDIGVPVVMAVRTGSDGFMAYGVGCSLSKAHAAKRALSELVQCAAFSTWPDVVASRERTLSALGGHPALLRAAQLDLDTGLLRDLPEQDLDPPVPGAPVPGQVRRVAAALERTGFTPVFRVLRSFGDAAHVVQVQVPGLDRFSQILEGRLATPVALRPRTQGAGAGRRDLAPEAPASLTL